MHYKQLISASLALLLGAGAAQADLINHGDVEDRPYGQIKYHQIGKNMWTTVPIEEWDDEIHKRSDFDHGIESQGSSFRPRSLELEARNFQSFCQSVKTCATEDGLVQLTGCMGAYVEAAAAAAGTAGTIWSVLTGKEFWTIAGASAVGGTITHYVTTDGSSSTSQPAAAQECSTSGSDKDALLSALSAGLEFAPSAYSLSMDVTGPTASYSITINAGPQDQKPPAPVSGQCFTA